MLSDNQRRTICRLVFLLGCMAPTAGVLYVILHRPTTADWERNIKAELGVEVRIEGLETPWPSITILRGVKLFDPEVGPLFEATEVAIEMTDSVNRVVIDQHLSLTKSGMVKLVELINEHPLRRHGVDRPWQIFCNGLTTIHEQNPQLSGEHSLAQTLTLENTQIRLQPLQEGTELQLRFQVAGEPMVFAPGQIMLPKPIVKGFLARSHAWEAGYSELLLGLDTQGVALPCWLVGDSIPEIQSLGTQARFQGSMEFAFRNGNPWVNLQGRFSQLDRQRFYRGMPFEGVDVVCEFDHAFKTWNAQLVDHEIRIPIDPIQLGQPQGIEQAIREAQLRPLSAEHTLRR